MPEIDAELAEELALWQSASIESMRWLYEFEAANPSPEDSDAEQARHEEG